MTNDDKELLTDAAAALGKTLTWTGPAADIPLLDGKAWNPIAGHADGAKLENELKIDIGWGEHAVEATIDGECSAAEFFVDYSGDRGKARRYASVCVAALLGKHKSGS